jgi:AcrR family transcriptional regulator
MSGQPGLRERKKQRTRETIARVAVELFEERGYEATTVAEIAEAADVSTRTVFSYFPSKEDILFCDFPEVKAALARTLDERPDGKDALETVRDFILSLDEIANDELHNRRVLIAHSDETLRNRDRARVAELGELLAAAIARDLNAAPDDLRPPLVAASLLAAFDALNTRPDTTERQDLAAVVDLVFTFVRGGLDALKTP